MGGNLKVLRDSKKTKRKKKKTNKKPINKTTNLPKAPHVSPKPLKSFKNYCPMMDPITHQTSSQGFPFLLIYIYDIKNLHLYRLFSDLKINSKFPTSIKYDVMFFWVRGKGHRIIEKVSQSNSVISIEGTKKHLRPRETMHQFTGWLMSGPPMKCIGHSADRGKGGPALTILKENC